jgi:hypothetical protein
LKEKKTIGEETLSVGQEFGGQGKGQTLQLNSQASDVVFDAFCLGAL